MTTQELLTIAQAAELLGVHPRTLRQWADRGHVAHVQTPGGHRRFLRAELERFVQRMGERAGGQNLEKAATKAIRAAITGDPGSPPARRSKFPVELTDEQRAGMRSVGRQMVGLVIRYAAGETEQGVLAQARQLGTSYGTLCRRAGMSVSTTIATFNFFRDPIIEVTFESVAENAGIDPSKPELYRRLDRFFSEVLMATVLAVEGNH
jgi:excisionase family DNA binding protein